MGDELRTFIGIGARAHTGTSGFTNFFSNRPSPEEVWRVHPEAVIVDGSDDWYAKPECRPQALVEGSGVRPLAWFHSGISGITKSGIVLSRADFNRLSAYYRDTFGMEITKLLTIYEP
jgi:hypothetical protein